MNQNLNAFAVVVSPKGGLPSVISKNSTDYWEFTNIGYETLHTGTKKECIAYQEEMMAQLIEIQYFD